jgi:solute:Na+ symporter, SSS family
LKDDGRSASDNIPMALLAWFAGCTMIWSALFAVGNYLYDRMHPAAILTVVFVASASVVTAIMRKLNAPAPVSPR